MQSLATAFDDTTHGRPESSRIVSFDFTNLAGPRGGPTAIVLRGDRSIEIREINSLPSAFDISVSGHLACRKASRSTDNVDAPADIPGAANELDDMVEFNGSFEKQLNLEESRNRWTRLYKKSPNISLGAVGEGSFVHLSSYERHKRNFALSTQPTLLSASEALSITSISRQRCLAGYGFDCGKNVQITSENPWLGDLWTWIGS